MNVTAEILSQLFVGKVVRITQTGKTPAGSALGPIDGKCTSVRADGDADGRRFAFSVDGTHYLAIDNACPTFVEGDMIGSITGRRRVEIMSSHQILDELMENRSKKGPTLERELRDNGFPIGQVIAALGWKGFAVQILNKDERSEQAIRLDVSLRPDLEKNRCFEIPTNRFGDTHPETQPGYVLLTYGDESVWTGIGFPRDQLLRGTTVPPGTKFARGADPKKFFPIFVTIGYLRMSEEGRKTLKEMGVT